MNKETVVNAITCLQTRPSQAVAIGEGWMYAVNYGQFQKVQNLLYVYILTRGNILLVQGCYRGDISMCCLEYRCELKYLETAFDVGEKWLKRYGDDVSKLGYDNYHPFNPKNKIQYWL